MKTIILLLVLITSLFSINISLSKSSNLVSTKALSLELASQAAWVALKECRKRGYSVAVAVVDRSGTLQALIRDSLAGPHTVSTATRKAWTTISFGQSTGILATMLANNKIPNQVQHIKNALLVGGGYKISTDGVTVAGIGVSGAPPGKNEIDSIDGACAKAGIKKIKDILDFAD